MGNNFKIETISSLNALFGLAPPKHPMIGIVDFSKVNFDTFGNTEYDSISTAFYGIILKHLKSGSLKYGRQVFDFQEGSLFFISPNQMGNLENPELEECKYNWGLFFHPNLFTGTSLFVKIADYTYFNYGENEVLHVSEDEKQSLREILETLAKEINRPIDKHTKKVLVSGLELILNHCERYYDRQFIIREASNKHVVSLLNQYLSAYFSSDLAQKNGLPTVKKCAEKVHLSPNYLSDLLKKEIGKSTQELIHYHLVQAAKNKLLSSTTSINQIAFSLGFEYPQYFAKLFKKKEGLTPTEFRNVN